VVITDVDVGFYDVLVRDTGGESISLQFQFK
jgi:hypothetical protein